MCIAVCTLPGQGKCKAHPLVGRQAAAVGGLAALCDIAGIKLGSKDLCKAGADQLAVHAEAATQLGSCLAGADAHERLCSTQQSGRQACLQPSNAGFSYC